MSSEIVFEMPDTDRPPALRAELRGAFPFGPEATATDRRTYFDTFDGRLWAAEGTLARVRTGDGTRWSWAPSGARPAAVSGAAGDVEYADDLPEPLRERLGPLVGTRRLFARAHVSRRTVTTPLWNREEKTVARVVVEEAGVTAPGGNGAVTTLAPTVRVEPVRGYEAEAARAVDILDAAGLERVGGGLYERALAVLGERPEGEDGKLRIHLDPEARTEDALREVLQRLLSVIGANREGAAAGWDVEFLHDLRVAVRRTRSAIGQVRGVFDKDALAPWREELAWLGRETGPARDLDVLDELFPKYVRDLPREAAAALEPLAEELDRQRARAQRALAEVLNGPRFASLMDGWGAFLGKATARGERGKDADRPVREVADERIARALQRVLKRGRAIDAKTPAARVHELRIAGKKLRYLMDFFRSLYAPEEIDPFRRALKGFQDDLGDFNDLEVHAGILERSATGLASAPPAMLIATGRLLERLALRSDRQRRRFQQHFAAFDVSDNHARAERLFGRRTEDAR